MNISSQSPEDVKNDVAAKKTSDSALARREEEMREKRRKMNAKTVEIDVAHAIQN